MRPRPGKRGLPSLNPLSRLRADLGISQAAMATALHRTDSTIARAEAGETRPEESVRTAWAEMLGVSSERWEALFETARNRAMIRAEGYSRDELELLDELGETENNAEPTEPDELP